MSDAERAHNIALGRLMTAVGDSGKFQKRFNLIFNIGLVVFASMINMNVVSILNVPDHTCFVPGRELTNFTAEKWRNMTLPIETDNRGVKTLSSCRMYNISSVPGDVDLSAWNFTRDDIVECQHGYEYDKRWYKTTLVSDENWVCDRELHVTNSFVYHRIGIVVGSFVFGQLADTLGRRPIFYISLYILVLGRILLIFTAHNYVLFAIISVVGCLTNASIFTAPLVIATEISNEKSRAHITMVQYIGWTVGLCLMSLIFWVFNEWKTFLLVTTLPCILFVFFPKYMVESPRWLVSKRKFRQCANELNKIAHINRRPVQIDEEYLLRVFPKDQLKVEKVYGMASLFSSWRLAKNTTLITACWICCNLSYYTMILNSSKMPGNPFLNFFYQNAAELPAYFVAKYLGDKIGRRITNTAAFVIIGIACVPIMLVMSHADQELLPNILVAFIRFMNSITYFIVYLQAIEIYPTCLRQTGMSIGMTVSNGMGVVGPYIVYLGTTYDARYPFLILCGLTMLGAASAFFLPETHLQTLPETLADAQAFGSKQSLWSMRQRVRHPSQSPPDADAEAMQSLNRKQ